jgi:hypothetical protein
LSALLVIWSSPPVEGHSHTPMSHCAMRIIMCDLTKCRLGGLECKRMQECHTLFELFLDPRIAGSREVDSPQLLLGRRIVLVLALYCRRQRDKDYEREERRDEAHKASSTGSFAMQLSEA